MKKAPNTYHHGNLAESLLDAVDEIASQYGLEAVTLRGCAKRVGVAPSSAFRHYTDKRALMTAFATRALRQLCAAMRQAHVDAATSGNDAFTAVSLAYVEFALDKPAFFRAMWREESIYTANEDYVRATGELAQQLQGGFANTLADPDPHDLNTHELLAWSSVHGLASLYVDGSVARVADRGGKLIKAREMIRALRPALALPANV